jgi:arylsulfatase B
MSTLRAAALIAALGCQGAPPPAVLVPDDSDLPAETDPPDTDLPDPPDTDPPVAPPPPANVLIVLADDIGVDAVSTLGTWPGAAPAPALDALAAQGVVFTRAWSNPVCSPSRASLLTGRHSRRTNIPEVLHPVTGNGGLALSELTLAELLRDAPTPAATAQVGKWHLATADVGGLDHPGLQGFQHVRGTTGNLTDGHAADGLPQDYFDYEKNTDGLIARSTVYATLAARDDAADLIATLPEPWFVYVALHAAHEPLHAPPADALPPGTPPATTEAEQYLQLVQSVDVALGRLLDGLDPDVRTRTWIVFAGDNGPAADTSPRPTTAARAKGTVYELGVRVPLIIAGPTVVPARIDAPVHLVDVFPTLADALGLDPGPVDGQSLLPWLRGAPPTPRVIYTDLWDTDLDLRAVTDGRYKLVRRGSQPLELYDLAGLAVEGPDLLLGALDADGEAALARLTPHLADGGGP